MSVYYIFSIRYLRRKDENIILIAKLYRKNRLHGKDKSTERRGMRCGEPMCKVGNMMDG